jgi:hypothetical protein
MRWICAAIAPLVSFSCGVGVAGELVGNAFDDKSEEPLLSVKITLTYDGEAKAFAEQSTNKMGKYGFKDIRKGTVKVTADRADYAFPTETTFLDDMQKTTIDFAGMRRPKDPKLAVAIAGSAVARIQLFDEPSVGVAAQWNSLTRYSFDADELHLLAREFANQSPVARQNREISEFANARPDQLKAAQKQFDAYMAKGDDRFETLDLSPSVFAIIGSRTASAYLDTHTVDDAANHKLESLYTILSKTWSPEIARSVKEGIETEKSIRRLRNFEWNAEFDKLGGMTDCSLKLRGNVGEITSQDAKVRAILNRIHYIPTARGISIQGKLNKDSSWFKLDVAKGAEDEIKGDWGKGMKIGEGDSVGSISGKAKEIY